MAEAITDFIKLHPLKRVPTLVELENLLAWLSDCNEVCMLEQTQDLKQVLLPWLHAKSDQAFGLGVSISKKLPDLRPIWTFYRSIEPEPLVEWAYASQDVALIHNMLLCFFPDEMFARNATGEYAIPPRLPSANGDGDGDADGDRSQSAENSQTSAPDGPAPFLQGSIEKLKLDCLLQSLASSRITGKLTINFFDRQGAIFFQDGAAVHSYLDGDEGHDAMLELLTVRSGDFVVFADEMSPAQSISRRMEALLMESAALMDYEDFLSEAGICESTVLEKIPMSYMEYLERMKDAPPLPEDIVSAVAASLDRPSSIEEIAARLGFSKAKWMPAIYGFIKCGVVRVSTLNETVRATHQQLLLSKASHVDDHSLLDVQTGLYSQSAFHFLMQLELTRAQVHNRRFSIIILTWQKKWERLLECEALSEQLRAIELLSRPTDLVCRFKGSGVALLLPDTGRAEAETMASRLQETWDKSIRARGLKEAAAPLTVEIGLACHPEDGHQVEDLIRAACESGQPGIEVPG